MKKAVKLALLVIVLLPGVSWAGVPRADRIPALGEAGLITLGLALMGAGVVAIRRLNAEENSRRPAFGAGRRPPEQGAATRVAPRRIRREPRHPRPRPRAAPCGGVRCDGGLRHSPRDLTCLRRTAPRAALFVDLGGGRVCGRLSGFAPAGTPPDFVTVALPLRSPGHDRGRAGASSRPSEERGLLRSGSRGGAPAPGVADGRRVRSRVHPDHEAGPGRGILLGVRAAGAETTWRRSQRGPLRSAPRRRGRCSSRGAPAESSSSPFFSSSRAAWPHVPSRPRPPDGRAATCSRVSWQRPRSPSEPGSSRGSFSRGDWTPRGRATLEAFLDTLIPDGRFPGHRATGVLPQLLPELEERRQTRRALVEGVELLDRGAKRAGSPSFRELDPARRADLVREIARAGEGTLPRFFYESVRNRAMEIHYASPAAWKVVGFTHAPQPEGYPDFAEKPGV